MAIGAGILVPISMGMAVNAKPPDPENYTAVEPFEWDLYDYEMKVHRAMQLGIAGATIAGLGAATFIAGAITWAITKRKTRPAH